MISIAETTLTIIMIIAIVGMHLFLYGFAIELFYDDEWVLGIGMFSMALMVSVFFIAAGLGL